MIFFPELFLYATIVGALVFSGVAVVVLLLLLLKDKQTNKVW